MGRLKIVFRATIHHLILSRPMSLFWICAGRTVSFLFLSLLRLIDPGAKVYIRNSQALGSSVAFVSDLDLTVVYQTVSRSKIRRLHRNLKLIFPFLGELCLYRTSDLVWLQEVINPFELERDPTILSQIKPVKIKSGTAKVVFISKMFVSDLSNLQSRAVLRQRKWAQHFSSIGEHQVDHIDDASVLSWLSNQLTSKTLTFDVQQFLRDAETRPLHEIQKIPPLVYSLFANRLCFRNPDLTPDSQSKELFWEVVRWELWILLYSFDTLSPNILKQHLQHLSDRLAVNSPFHNHDLELKLVELKQRIRDEAGCDV